MSKKISMVTLQSISEGPKNECMMETNLNTHLHISNDEDITKISLPFGNRVDVINGVIIIHEK